MRKLVIDSTLLASSMTNSSLDSSMVIGQCHIRGVAWGMMKVQREWGQGRSWGEGMNVGGVEVIRETVHDDDMLITFWPWSLIIQPCAIRPASRQYACGLSCDPPALQSVLGNIYTE